MSSGATCCHKTATPSSKLAKKTPVPIVVSTKNHSQPSYKPYLKPYSYWSYKPITWIPTIRFSAFPGSNTDSTTVRPTMQSHCTRRSSCSLFAQTWDLMRFEAWKSLAPSNKHYSVINPGPKNEQTGYTQPGLRAGFSSLLSLGSRLLVNDGKWISIASSQSQKSGSVWTKKITDHLQDGPPQL